MKPSQLTPEQKTRLLAELDGWTPTPDGKWTQSEDGITGKKYLGLPDYSTSYDAIIPLVQKQSWNIRNAIDKYINEYLILEFITTATPTQLCDAVLVATGKAEL